MTRKPGILMLLIFVIAGMMFTTMMSGCGVAKDSKIQLEIKDKLAADLNIPQDALTVNVKNGVATISGELGSQDEIDRVVEIAYEVEGVTLVENLMVLVDDWHSTNPTFNDYGMI